MNSPLLFISYSHDSADHKEWVLRLATDLRNNGVDASLDQWDLAPGQDTTLFMQRGIVESDRVLLICTEAYVDKSEVGIGGVGYERLIVTAEVVESIDTKKFIPLIRANRRENPVPKFLGPRLYLDFSDDDKYEERLEELLRELLGAPASEKLLLGENPFSGKLAPQPKKARATSPTGRTDSGTPILDDEWFVTERNQAISGIGQVNLMAHMELRFALHESLNKTQLELLNTVRKSEIHTFGWPIGVVLDNRDEYRPMPYGDGIRAEVRIEEDSMSGAVSYDYWAFRNNGDFYLLQSLFEDQRRENEIFFNTRIVRVTESLLFAERVYHHLSVPESVELSIRVTHRGLAGRSLTSSTPSRHLGPRKTMENESSAEIVVPIGQISETLVELVQQLLEPMFMLFEFQQFQNEVYTDIVRRFEKGEVS